MATYLLVAVFQTLGVISFESPPGVCWYPDSSGLIFPEIHGQMFQYDLKSRKVKLLFQHPAVASTCLPAIPPDGKRILLGQINRKGPNNQVQLEILIMDFQGKVLERPLPLALGDWGGEAEDDWIKVFWCGVENKILLDINNNRSHQMTVLYDLANQKGVVWKNHYPVYGAGSPVCPDKRGFLLLHRESLEGHGFQFGKECPYLRSDWNGKTQRVKIPPGTVLPESIPDYTQYRNTTWKGSKCLIPSRNIKIWIDTQKLELTTEKAKISEWVPGGEVIWSRRSFSGGQELTMFTNIYLWNAPVRYPGFSIFPNTNFTKVVYAGPGHPDGLELIGSIDPIFDGDVCFQMSPDGKRIALRLVNILVKNHTSQFYIIEENGTISNRFRYPYKNQEK